MVAWAMTDPRYKREIDSLDSKALYGDRAARERALASGRRRVDFLLEDSRSLRNNLGRPDQQRLDEFLQSLSEVEDRLIRSEDWLGKALPQVDRSKINLDVSPFKNCIAHFERMKARPSVRQLLDYEQQVQTAFAQAA